jgi:hypothetical protein
MYFTQNSQASKLVTSEIQASKELKKKTHERTARPRIRARLLETKQKRTDVPPNREYRNYKAAGPTARNRDEKLKTYERTAIIKNSSKLHQS